jgi:uncharacterized repeat protein (TIGR02543 family)
MYSHPNGELGFILTLRLIRVLGISGGMKTLTAALAALVLIGTAHAKVVYVDDNASAGGDGTSWANAYKYLQDALADVNASDEIWVAEGTYKPDQGAGITEGNRTATFNLVNGVGMYGGFKGTETTRTPLGDGNQTILSGEIDSNSSLWSLHVVYGENLDASTTMNGFRITKGKANGNDEGVPFGNGGGMVLKSSSPILTNCVFSNNSAGFGDGGGLENNSSSPTLTNCVFTGNSAFVGAGMFNHSNSSPTLINCMFANNNSSGMGGGMANYDSSSSPTLTNCVFSGNSALWFGGGMGNSGSPILTNCVFTGNYMGQMSLGGGFGDARGGGGGMDNFGSPILTNCVFTGNSAGVGGGVLDVNDSGTYKNTIFHQNTSDMDHADLIHGQVEGVPLSKVSYCLVSGGYSGTGNVDGSPLFVNIDDPIGPDGKWFTADDGLRLKGGSPAIDAGYNASLPADTYDLDNDGNTTEPIPLDIAGFSRFQGDAVDLGPYESTAKPQFTITAIATPETGGTAIGGGTVYEGFGITLTATPASGYLFTGWSGDANETTNPLSITVDANKTINANFAQDLRDDDGDGLSNYAELVTYGTDKTKADTDGDGLSDKQELDAGGDPKISTYSWSLATDLGNGWKRFDWFGSYYEHSSGWIYHTDLGWLYRVSEGTDSIWLYLNNHGWLWTSLSVCPYFYDAKTSNWMYFKSGDDKPRFYHYGTKAWVTLGE